MPKAYSYIRFSTPEQARGDSLRRQTEGAEAWCAERGIELDDTIRDLGVSAYHGNNRISGALRTFLDLVEKGKIERGSFLLVESLDRLSREAVLDAATRLFDLINAGITVVTLSDGHEFSRDGLLDNWSPLLIAVASMARAHEESRIKSQRVGKAWRRKKDEAREERRPLTPRGPSWLELKDGQWREIPDRVEIVRRIFRETIQGFGRREIVRRLNADGVPTFRSGENREVKPDGWQESSIGKVQRGRAVIGEYQPHLGTHKARNRRPDGDPIPDFYPAVVSLEDFSLAQEALDGRRGPRSAGRKGNRGAHVLQGLARCGECGGPMHVKNKGQPPKGGIYLACSRSYRKAGCDNARRWRLDRLEARVLRFVGFLEPQAFASASPDSDVPDAAGMVAAARARLADAEARRKRLLALYVNPDDLSDDDLARQHYAEATAEAKTLKAELRQAERRAAVLAADPGAAARLADVRDLTARMEAAGEEERRDLKIRLASALRSVVRRVELYAGIGAVVVMKPLTASRNRYVLDGSRLDEGEPVNFQMRNGHARLLLEYESPATGDEEETWSDSGPDTEHWDKAHLFEDSPAEG